MRPWQIMGIAAIILNGLIILAFSFTGHSNRIFSVIAAALIPTLISLGLLFWVDKQQIDNASQLQKINIFGFFIKVILLGAWAAMLLNAKTLHNVTFIVILLLNFLAWHGVEAYYWPLFMGRSGQADGENT
ncbi:MAG: hypothetical protein K9N35_05230 [Candidatus Marinimicrobia bacterium]|nr:hypothetical protein [Candidatus Neomarinimicrobiota bacterium]